MPRFDVPSEYGDMARAVSDLVAAFATHGEASHELTEQIRSRVKPQLIDWNLGRTQAILAKFGAETPEGYPPPPPRQAEPLRVAANAALRLQRAAEQHQSGDEQWHAGLPLVALLIVFHDLGGGGNPLYNHVEAEGVPAEARAAHQRVCAKLRTELDAMTKS